ncbi:MAG TPA: choice-of-anchor B family protein, partial [Bacteroidia bacterium]|nr:choice-of-anchor B family protein [Bacteroidia bacterium]
DIGMSIVDVTNPSSPVEVVQIPNVNNLWKEIKVFKHYAYVTTEGGGGLQIVDLRNLPGTNLPYHNYTGDGAINGQLNTIHSLHVDTAAQKVYLYGSNLFNGAAVALDLSVDPYNPTYLGHYGNVYVHDGYVDNDTIFAAHIYNGYFTEANVSNLASPNVLATQTTTTSFTHNTWLSDDHRYCFTTDENTNSYLTCYDVSDPGNIQETDKIQSQNPNSGSIVHNTHILHNWAVTSWYRDGFVITDITRPNNLVNVGWYDTYTSGSGNGFNGAWGVYPFLPSGTIVVSNIEDGLWVFTPNYVRACYLEGTIRDSICNTPLSGVTVTIGTVNVSDVTNAGGVFATGTAVPGTYNVTFSKPGYQNYVINNVTFSPGVVDTFNIKMFSSTAVALNGNLSNSSTSSAIAGAQVILTSPNNTYNYVTDVNGDYSSCNVVADGYDYGIGAWGYWGMCGTDSIYNGHSTQSFQLAPGYQDDFTFDLGWTVTNSSGLTTGAWVRGEPQGTTYNNPGDANPEYDVNNDCFDKCYVTGNTGTSSSDDDVDNGSTTLKSPPFDVTSYTEPWIHYSRWFFNAGGSGNPNDSLIIRLTNGTTTVTVETVTASTPGMSSWVNKAFRISDYMTPSANMRLLVYTADVNPGHLVEAGFDNFYILDSVTSGIHTPPAAVSGVNVYPNPFTGATQVSYTLKNAPSANSFMTVTDVTGRVVFTQQLVDQNGTIQLGSDLADGIYFVRVTDGAEASEAVRLVKTH